MKVLVHHTITSDLKHKFLLLYINFWFAIHGVLSFSKKMIFQFPDYSSDFRFACCNLFCFYLNCSYLICCYPQYCFSSFCFYEGASIGPVLPYVSLNVRPKHSSKDSTVRNIGFWSTLVHCWR